MVKPGASNSKFSVQVWVLLFNIPLYKVILEYLMLHYVEKGSINLKQDLSSY